MNAIICGTGGRAPPLRNMRWPLSLGPMARQWLTLLQDLVGLAQFTDLALQVLDPVFLSTRQTAALTGITFGLLAPDTQAVRRTAKPHARSPCKLPCRWHSWRGSLGKAEHRVREVQPDRRGCISALT
jgi:hypothetical protein